MAGGDSVGNGSGGRVTDGNTDVGDGLGDADAGAGSDGPAPD
jgi:hypothetical protein